MELLEVDQAEKSYNIRKFGNSYRLMAVNDVSFSLKKGSCVGLVGESGCGKSTLGRLITGLEKPTKGQVRFLGESVYSATKRGRKLPFAGKIQMVFQDSYDAVNPRYTAEQIVEEPLRNLMHLSVKERKMKVSELLRKVGIPDSEKNKYAMEFSGGQLQRVCIARALACEPQLLVLDEPLSSLDVSVQAQILNLLGDIKDEGNLSYLLISHDLEAIYYLADSIIVMYGGQIMEQIDDISLFYEMKHPYTKMLLSSIPSYRNQEEKSETAESIWMDLGVQKEGYTGCPYYGRCPEGKEVCKQKRPEIRKIRKGQTVACHMIDD